jgi:hypothetical protein
VPSEQSPDDLFNERIAVGSLFNSFFEAPVDVKIDGQHVAVPETIE